MSGCGGCDERRKMIVDAIKSGDNKLVAAKMREAYEHLMSEMRSRLDDRIKQIKEHK